MLVTFLFPVSATLLKVGMLHERLTGTALAGMVNILLVLLIIDGRQAYWPDEEEGNGPDLTIPDGDRNG